MRCSHCQSEIPNDSRFCSECGSRQQRVCTQCGAEAAATAKFCNQCGTPLGGAGASPPAASFPGPSGSAGTAPPASIPPGPSAAVSPAAPAEPAPPVPRPEGGGTPAAPKPTETSRSTSGARQQATVLLCQLGDPVELARRLGAEPWHALLEQVVSFARKQAEQLSGTVTQILDNGYQVVFGAPRALEDHARRGLLAAAEALRRLPRMLDEASGDDGSAIRIGVATGTVVVGESEQLIIGAATSLAGRLGSAAEPSSAAVSMATVRLVSDLVEVENGSARRLEGAEEPAEYVVFTEGGLPDEAEGVRETAPAASVFVGRQAELEVLLGLCDRARRGEGQVVGISGEAGSGKTRLLQELHARLAGEPMSYLPGRCLSYGSGIPFVPFVQMLRTTSHIERGDDLETVSARLSSTLERIGASPDILPYLLRMLGFDVGHEESEALEPHALQNRVFGALRQMILSASQRSLVILELEDLHWIDDTSQQFLSSIMEWIGAAPVLVVITYRTEYSPFFLGKSFTTEIPLRRLSENDSRALIQSILRQKGLSRVLTRRILQKAEGNPFFLEELARKLVDDPDPESESVPDTVHGLLMARIDRLPAEHRTLLRTVSVLGREFPVQLATALWDEDQPVDALLQDLKRREFLYETPTEDGVYFFRHALTQEVAYQSLLESRQKELHRLAAEAVERIYAGHLEDYLDELVHHYPRAGNAEKTVYYLDLFADRAVRANAHHEAANALRQAVRYAAELPEDQRDRRIAELVLKLAASLLPLAGFSETLEICRDHLAQVEKLGDSALLARFHFWLAHTYSYVSLLDRSSEHAQLAISAAEEAEDTEIEGLALYVVGRNEFWRGSHRAGLEASERAVILLERSGSAWWQGHAYGVASFHYFALGQYDQAQQSARRALAISKALDDYRLDPSWGLGYFYASLGEAEKGIEMCEAGLQTAKDPLNQAAALGFLGFARLVLGDVEAAITDLEEAVGRLEGTGMQQLLGWFQAYLGEAYAEHGRLSIALETSHLGKACCQGARFPLGEALATRSRGRILLSQGQAAEARAHLEEARSLFDELEIQLEAALTRLDLAQLEHSAGDPETAGLHLLAARESFAELDLPAFLDRVQKTETAWRESARA